MVNESCGETVTALVSIIVVEIPLFEVERTLKMILGRRGGATATTACCKVLLPPGPLQTREYVVVLFTLLNVTLPDIGCSPVHPSDATHCVAPLLDQLRIVEPLYLTDEGCTLNVTVGNGGGITLTVTVCDALPPVPEQVSVKLLVAVRAVRTSLLAVGLFPAQLPDAIQPVALVDDQLSVLDSPLATELGVALNVTVGVTTGTTATVTDWTVLPPVPVQVSVKVPLAVIELRVSLPEVALLPLHAPLAVHAVALVVDQVNVELLPLVTINGFALIDRVGTGVTGGCTVTVETAFALPPGPVHKTLNVLVADSEPVLWLPEVAIALDQLPDAVQDDALVLDHVSTVDPL